ncbi:hypothetical protein CR513_37684, partial [Mucuna pruriens]
MGQELDQFLIKEAKGIDPSLSEFYFHTHKKGSKLGMSSCKICICKTSLKKENSKYLLKIQHLYREKMELRINHPQITCLMIYGWKEKGRISRLGSVGRTLILSSSQPSKSSTSLGDVYALRIQIQTLNESLQRQEQEKLVARQKLTETRKQVHTLVQYLRFFSDSSSHPPSSPKHSNENEDEDNENEDEDYEDNYHTR